MYRCPSILSVSPSDRNPSPHTTGQFVMNTKACDRNIMVFLMMIRQFSREVFISERPTFEQLFKPAQALFHVDSRAEHAFPKVAHATKPRRRCLHGEARRIEVIVHLIPSQWCRNRCPFSRSKTINSGEGLPPDILKVVEIYPSRPRFRIPQDTCRLRKAGIDENVNEPCELH
jgi:hypothetical protein